jgi:hypothetical protein
MHRKKLIDYRTDDVHIPTTPTWKPGAPRMSWRSEVLADSSDEWCWNTLRFATAKEAAGYAANLALRWTLVRDFRVIECKDPVTHTFIDDQLVRLEVSR